MNRKLNILVTICLIAFCFNSCTEVDDIIRDPVPEIIDHDGSIEPKNVRCTFCVEDPSDTDDSKECGCLEANECELKDLPEKYQGDLIGCSIQPSEMTALERCNAQIREPNPACSTLRFGDGRGGILTKLGDHRGEYTVLAPGTWNNFTTVDAQRTDGTWERLTFKNCANPESTGAFRKHFRGRVGDACQNFTGALRFNDVVKSCEISSPNSACSRNDKKP